MDHAEVINRVKDLVPEIQRTHDPKGALLKLAREEDLSPAQLERVAQMFNTAKTLTFLDKSANRGGSFKLVDTEDLLDAYTAHSMPKAASVQIKQAAAELDPDDINSWIEPAQTKQASERFPRAEWAVSDVFIEGVEKPSTRTKQASDERRAAHGTRIVLDLIAEVRDQHNEICLNKIAALRQAAIDGAWTTVEEDAVLMLGEDARPALDEAVAHIERNGGIKVARFEGPSRRKLAYDRTGYVQTVAELADAYDVVRKSWVLEDMEKAAAGSVITQAPDGTEVDLLAKQMGGNQKRINPRHFKLEEDVVEDDGDPDMRDAPSLSPTGRRQQRPDIPPRMPSIEPNKGMDDSGPRREVEHPKVMEALLAGMRPVAERVGRGPQMRTPWEAALGIKTRDLFNPGSNKKQQYIDDSVADDDSLIMLQRFMASDPVISEADPDMVVGVFNAIRSINPEFAGDPHRMRLALRDAIQYESLPIHSIKDLAALRTETAKGEAAIAKNRSDLYRTGGSKGGKGGKDKDDE